MLTDGAFRRRITAEEIAQTALHILQAGAMMGEIVNVKAGCASPREARSAG